MHNNAHGWPRAVVWWGVGLAFAGGFLIAPQVYRRLSGWLYAGDGMIAAGTGAAPLFVYGFALMLSLVFISALITEKAARRARYGPALGKSVFVALLVFGVATLYERQVLASRARLAQQLNLTIPRGLDPLAAGVWATTVALVLFGPVDLMIAKWQRRRADPDAGVAAIRFDHEK